MYDERLLNQIREYVRQNRAAYTLDALRARMLRDGVPAEAIDHVLAEQQGSPYLGPAPEAAPGAAPSRFPILVFFGILALSVFVNIVVLIGAGFLSAEVNNSLAFFLVCGLAAVGEIVAAVAYAKKNPTVTVAIVVALAVTPIVIGALLLGACVVVLWMLNWKIGG